MRCFLVFQEYLRKKKGKKKQTSSTTVLHLHWNYCLITFSNLLLQAVILVSFKTFQHARLLHVQVLRLQMRARATSRAEPFCAFANPISLSCSTCFLLNLNYSPVLGLIFISLCPEKKRRKKKDSPCPKTVLKNQLKSEFLIIWSIHTHNLCWQKVQGKGKQGREEENMQVSLLITHTHGNRTSLSHNKDS